MVDPDLISQADHIPVLIKPIVENISPSQAFGLTPPLVVEAIPKLY